MEKTKHRRNLNNYRFGKKLVIAGGLTAILGLIFFYIPLDILNSLPATGGDTGSHFWPLHTLVHEGLPKLHIKMWNPGNLGGEPQLVHYFPLPFLIMALLSVIMPLGTAFNIGTMLPVVLFPLCVYYCFKLMRAKFPVPLLASAFSLVYLYNESFSMWGGNTLSTLAGQFAHVYAFDFFLLGLGALAWELRKGKFPFWSALLFTAVLTSHFYVGLLLPFVYIFFLFFERTLPFWQRFKILAWSAIFANLMSAWFVIPMLDNAKWTSPYAFVWQSQNLLLEIFPRVFWPLLLIVFVSALLFLLISFYRKTFEEEWRIIIPMWIMIILVSVGLYFLFPKVGLVDIRALPQIQMAVCFVAAIYMGLLLNRYTSRPVGLTGTVILVIASILWTAYQVKNFPGWMKWNYSGWQGKAAYPQTLPLWEKLKGDFSQPRIAYENNEMATQAGTIRIFEMLPYFASRATTESVYHQATIYSPLAFYFQSLISATPSCPFPEYGCTQYNADKTAQYMDILGISQIIAMTPEVTAQLDKAAHLTKEGSFGFFHLYSKKTPTSLVDVIHPVVEWNEHKEYRHLFFNWFKDYRPGKTFIVNSEGVSPEEKEALNHAKAEIANCKPEVKVQFDELDLTTDCPGALHLLKFAFHSAWKSASGEKLYLVSPGYIGIIPQQTETKLVWGDKPLWNWSAAISWLSLAALVVLTFLFARRKVKP